MLSLWLKAQNFLPNSADITFICRFMKFCLNIMTMSNMNHEIASRNAFHYQTKDRHYKCLYVKSSKEPVLSKCMNFKMTSFIKALWHVISVQIQNWYLIFDMIPFNLIKFSSVFKIIQVIRDEWKFLLWLLETSNNAMI